MKKYFACLSLVILFAIPIKAQETKNPDVDAVFLKISKEYTFNADGSYDYRCVKQVKILTFFAIHRLYGETFVVYNPEYQELHINDCYTLMADGKKVITPANAFNEVLPRFAAAVPVYNHLKEMVITHTALERGATVFLDYTLHSKKGFSPAIMGMEELAETNPVGSYDVIVRIPAAATLNYRLFNTVGEPLIRYEGGKKVHTWHFSDLKPIITEPLQPENVKFIPTLAFTTAKDIPQVLSAFTSQPAFKAEWTDEIMAYAEKIRKDNPDEMKTILALQEKVVNDFTLYQVPLPMIAFKVRPAAEVWKSAGGTAVEKCLLFTSMLNSLGIQAEPAALFTGYFDNKFGSLSNMDQIYIYISLKDKTNLLFSVTGVQDQDLSAATKGAVVLLSSGRLAEPIALQSFQNIISISGRQVLEEDNIITGKITLLRGGAENPYFQLLRKPSKKTGISGISLSDCNDSREVSVDREKSEILYRYEKKTACKQQGEYYFYSWPFAEGGINSWHTGEMVGGRSNPFSIPYPLIESYALEMELPRYWQLVNPVTKLEITNSAGSLSAECRQLKNKVYWNLELKLYEAIQNQTGNDYYTQVKDLLARYSTLKSQGSVFKRMR